MASFKKFRALKCESSQHFKWKKIQQFEKQFSTANTVSAKSLDQFSFHLAPQSFVIESLNLLWTLLCYLGNVGLSCLLYTKSSSSYVSEVIWWVGWTWYPLTVSKRMNHIDTKIIVSPCMLMVRLLSCSSSYYYLWFYSITLYCW